MPFFQALNKNFTICGVEKRLFFLIFSFSAIIPYSARFRWQADLIAGTIFFSFYIVAFYVTKADSQMIDIFKRYIGYKDYYAPISGIHAHEKRLTYSVSEYEGKRGIS